MVNCAAYGCKSRSERKLPGISFHRFPKSEISDAWLQNMQVMNWTPTENDRLCSLHFESKWFQKTAETTRLQPKAAPTIFPNLPSYLQLEKSTKCRKRDIVPESKVIGNLSSNQHQSSKTLDSVLRVLKSDQICRLCMKDLTDAKNIFEDHLEDNVPIHLAMAVCLYPMQVSINDPFSKYACGKCLDTLSSFVKFRTFTLRNDKIHRENLASLVSKEENLGLKRKIEAKYVPQLTKKRKTDHISDEEEPNIVMGNMDVNLGNIASMPDSLLDALKIYRKSKLVDQCEEQTSISNENVNPNEQGEIFIIQVDNDKSSTTPKLHVNTSVDDLHRGTDKNEHEQLNLSTMAQSEKDSEQLGRNVDAKVDIPNDFLTTYANVSFCMANGYLMEHKILKENLRYLKCASAKCPAVGTQEVLMPGAYKNQLVTIKNHNHERPTEIEIKKQKLISVVRKKLQNAKGLSIKSIYDEVCRIVPATTQLVPMKNLLKEICNL